MGRDDSNFNSNEMPALRNRRNVYMGRPVNSLTCNWIRVFFKCLLVKYFSGTGGCLCPPFNYDGMSVSISCPHLSMNPISTTPSCGEPFGLQHLMPQVSIPPLMAKNKNMLIKHSLYSTKDYIFKISGSWVKNCIDRRKLLKKHKYKKKRQ